MPRNKKLKIAEIFKSIHGELPRQGEVAAIVRLSGCRTLCGYCDAKKYWGGKGKEMDESEIVAAIRRLKTKSVLVTGGEPLMQRGTKGLLGRLEREGLRVVLETDGSYSLAGIPAGVTVVMDLKTPSSGARRRPMLSNLRRLKGRDLLKVVVSSLADYEWAKGVIKKQAGSLKCEVAFSPVEKKISAARLAARMIADNSPHRMQIQLHKYLGVP